MATTAIKLKMNKFTEHIDIDINIDTDADTEIDKKMKNQSKSATRTFFFSIGNCDGVVCISSYL